MLDGDDAPTGGSSVVAADDPVEGAGERPWSAFLLIQSGVLKGDRSVEAVKARSG